KVIDKQAHKADILMRLRREFQLMESLDHPHIVKLHEVIETQFSIYVCMEYVEGCSLEQHLKNQEHGKLPEKEARKIIRELASAVSHCHSRFVVHRDIKPANILITTAGKVMLIDFGLGNVFSFRSRLNTICGSLPYYSPEIARGSSYTGPEIDIWCLGIVLYRITVGRDPFIGSTKREVKLQITQNQFQPPSTLSPTLQDALRKLLSPESVQRRSLSILETDIWLHEDDVKGQPRFLSEDRSFSQNSTYTTGTDLTSATIITTATDSSRLSGATLVRQASKATSSTTTAMATAAKSPMTLQKRSYTDDGLTFIRSPSSSLYGSQSLMLDMADMVGAYVWELEREQPRFLRKDTIRILPGPGAKTDLLFQQDRAMSLLQYMVPILQSCRVSYYLHSTTRILCGICYTKDMDSSVTSCGLGQPSQVLQRLVRQLGAVMTGTSVQAAKHPLVRCGVFSIDIVPCPPKLKKTKETRGEKEVKMLESKEGKYLEELVMNRGYELSIKRLYGSSSTTRHFKRLFRHQAAQLE
ncbi:MAP microtubule affinity-regulating kinase 1, partial [Lunasporangiospora selenospora]